MAQAQRTDELLALIRDGKPMTLWTKRAVDEKSMSNFCNWGYNIRNSSTKSTSNLL